MRKNIQKYLLLNYPLLWNMRIIPALFGIILINIFFFCVGYFNTQISFSYFWDDNYVISHGVIYFGAVVSALLCFIYWMMQYSKNNAFKVFYPKTVLSLYSEWLLIFILVIGLVLFPYSFYRGETTKAKSYMEKQEALQAAEVLNMTSILIPNSKHAYLDENRYVENSFDGNSVTDTGTVFNSFSEQSVTVVPQNQEIVDSSMLTLCSLLNYTEYRNSFIPSKYWADMKGVKEVISWLEVQDKKKVSELMDAFLQLQKKHDLPTNLTKDKWLELVYNPPAYIVGDFNLISRNAPDYLTANSHRYDGSRYYNDNQNDSIPYYLPYKELTGGYQKILSAYANTEASQTSDYAMWIIYVALFFSMHVISFRVTSGKKWLVTLLVVGVGLIINSLLIVIVDLFVHDASKILYSLVLILAFLYGLVKVSISIGTNSHKAKKKYSSIWINYLFWFLPFILILLYWVLLIIADWNSLSSFWSSVDKFLEEHAILLLWGNIVFVFIFMCYLLRLALRWKSLPEE